MQIGDRVKFTDNCLGFMIVNGTTLATRDETWMWVGSVDAQTLNNVSGEVRSSRCAGTDTEWLVYFDGIGFVAGFSGDFDLLSGKLCTCDIWAGGCICGVIVPYKVEW